MVAIERFFYANVALRTDLSLHIAVPAEMKYHILIQRLNLPEALKPHQRHLISPYSVYHYPSLGSLRLMTCLSYIFLMAICL